MLESLSEGYTRHLVRALICYFIFAAALPQVKAQWFESEYSKGEYLARASNCISCHTAPSGEPYAGGLRIVTPFGVFNTPNITPDRETGIGEWTRLDFYRAMHEGVGRHGKLLYPSFPYTSYTKMLREDV